MIKHLLLLALIQSAFSCTARSTADYEKELTQSTKAFYLTASRDTEKDSGVDTHLDVKPQVANKAGDESTLLELQEASINQLNYGGQWAFEFIHIDSNGHETVLTQYNIHQPLKPASTQKLFTTYLAYLNGYSKDRLAALLHVSQNEMAQAAFDSTIKKTNSSSGEILLKSAYADLEDIEYYNPVDGSGLSYANRATVRLETSLLRKIYFSGNYDDYKLLLAHPKHSCIYDVAKFELHPDHSTLEKYLSPLAGRLFAKTGSLGITPEGSPHGSTKALSGYLESKNGNGVIVFSIIGDYLPQVIDGEDNLATTIGFSKIQAIVKAHADYLDQNK